MEIQISATLGWCAELKRVKPIQYGEAPSVRLYWGTAINLLIFLQVIFIKIIEKSWPDDVDVVTFDDIWDVHVCTKSALTTVFETFQSNPQINRMVALDENSGD